MEADPADGLSDLEPLDAGSLDVEPPAPAGPPDPGLAAGDLLEDEDLDEQALAGIGEEPAPGRRSWQHMSNMRAKLTNDPKPPGPNRAAHAT